MRHKYCFEAVHRTLCDVRDEPNLLFGGLPVVLGGDFAQILPVIIRGNCAAIVDAYVQRSFLWRSLRCRRIAYTWKGKAGPRPERYMHERYEVWGGDTEHESWITKREELVEREGYIKPLREEEERASLIEHTVFTAVYSGIAMRPLASRLAPLVGGGSPSYQLPTLSPTICTPL